MPHHAHPCLLHAMRPLPHLAIVLVPGVTLREEAPSSHAHSWDVLGDKLSSTSTERHSQAPHLAVVLVPCVAAALVLISGVAGATAQDRGMD